MPYMPWKECYNLDYKNIDEQHRGLLEILNDLIGLLESGREPEKVKKLSLRLFECSRIHFATEERYMLKAHFADILAHKAKHTSFLRKLLEFNETYEPSNSRICQETANLLGKWYVHHIMQTDMAYVPCLKGLYTQLDVKALLFDFGSVINRFDTHRFAGRLAATCQRNPEEVHSLLYQKSTLTQDYESGAIDSESFLGRLSSLCDYPFHDSELAEAYSYASTPLEGTWEILQRLKPHFCLALVADSSKWHFERIIENSSVFPLFDTVTLSYQVGALRPDPRLWEDALIKLDMISEECACITDHEAFVAAAKAQLFHGIQFSSLEKLGEDLWKAGIHP